MAIAASLQDEIDTTLQEVRRRFTSMQDESNGRLVYPLREALSRGPKAQYLRWIDAPLPNSSHKQPEEVREAIARDSAMGQNRRQISECLFVFDKRVERLKTQDPESHHKRIANDIRLSGPTGPGGPEVAFAIVQRPRRREQHSQRRGVTTQVFRSKAPLTVDRVPESAWQPNSYQSSSRPISKIRRRPRSVRASAASRLPGLRFSKGIWECG